MGHSTSSFQQHVEERTAHYLTKGRASSRAWDPRVDMEERERITSLDVSRDLTTPFLLGLNIGFGGGLGGFAYGGPLGITVGVASVLLMAMLCVVTFRGDSANQRAIEAKKSIIVSSPSDVAEAWSDWQGARALLRSSDEAYSAWLDNHRRVCEVVAILSGLEAMPEGEDAEMLRSWLFETSAKARALGQMEAERRTLAAVVCPAPALSVDQSKMLDEAALTTSVLSEAASASLGRAPESI